MATDKSEPRIGLIFKVGVLSIGTLLIVHGGLVAYFDAIAHAEEERKYGEIKPEALMSVRQDESQRLAAGPMPIQKAMQDVAASRGRGRGEGEIVPSASKDLAPLAGWTQMPAEVPPEMTAEPAAPAIPEVTADAGAAMAASLDGGVTGKGKHAPLKPDTHAPTKPPPKKP